MDKTTKRQDRFLKELALNTHVLWTPEFVTRTNKLFNTKIKPHRYEADGDINPKGLTLHNGASHSVGLSSWELAMQLCNQLGVAYEAKLGRGFQVHACVNALREAGYGK